ncbi:chemotaxis protein CheW [Zoogloea sp.]|jgi:purine-binding chemotaxis protein CheW|uniref:chemotaxis protein CheW n=1 Tax=Zoogloea sp. TaxID=49181 RepID=UPI0037D9C794
MATLARKDALAVAAEPRQYLTFTLGGEMYAVETLSVKEIIEYGQVTTVPMMPPSIRGVINLRGAVVPVIDLKARFGGKPTEITRRTCIVIIEMGGSDECQVLGILVDTVSEVLEIPPGEVEAPPAFGARIRADFILGMGKVAGGFVILLNVEAVLSTDELSVLDELSRQGTPMDAGTLPRLGSSVAG